VEVEVEVEAEAAPAEEGAMAISFDCEMDVTARRCLKTSIDA